MKTLRDLLDGVAVQAVSGSLDTPITGVASDSRSVQPGNIFVCLPGYATPGGEKRSDRHDYATQAVANGAVALVVERDVQGADNAIVVRVSDGWSALANISCNFYDHPSRRMTMIGVTGTSGKTSSSYFIDSVLRAAGKRVARFGTIEYLIDGESVPAVQTTPEANELQRLLRAAVDRGVEACVMEVSSHALELRRVGGVAFDVAAFTNLSQDHLNFHPDMHAYLRAKGRLFQELESGGKAATAVVNIDDPHSAHVIEVNSGRLLTYGTRQAASIRATDIATDLQGARFRLHTPSAEHDVALPHLGDYQIHNALTAVGVGCALGLDGTTIVRGITTAPEVPGRFELVDRGQNFRVVVDYAHKPDALERLLRCGRALEPDRLILVFGCGGDRDRGKRAIMGRLAAELSDVAIVTSDNPRSEPPQNIVDEIVAGMADEATVERIVEVDRGKAIARAIEIAQPRDLVLIAGKGHEDYQLVGSEKLEFDDRTVAGEAIEARLGG